MGGRAAPGPLSGISNDVGSALVIEVTCTYPLRATTNRLSPRQEQVLLLLGDGLGLGEVAGQLGISAWTARTHRDEGRRRLGARTTAQAAVLVRENRAAAR